MRIIRHLPCLTHTRTFHQLDVDSMVCTLDRRYVRKPLDRLVGEYRKRTSFCDPCVVLQPFLGHRLLDHDDAVLLQPEDLIQRLLAVLPALIGIDGERKVSDLADGVDHLFVIVQSDLDLENLETVSAFAGLFAHNFRCIYAYRECGVGSLGRIQAPKTPPWLSEELADKIVKGYVNRCFCRSVFRRKAVDICEDGVKLERVVELSEIDT